MIGKCTFVTPLPTVPVSKIWNFRTFCHFRVFRNRVMSNRETDPGFGFRTQKMYQNDMSHAYILSFFEKSKIDIYIYISIDRYRFSKKETRYIYTFFFFYSLSNAPKIIKIRCGVPELWLRTDTHTQTHGQTESQRIFYPHVISFFVPFTELASLVSPTPLGIIIQSYIKNKEIVLAAYLWES